MSAHLRSREGFQCQCKWLTTEEQKLGVWHVAILTSPGEIRPSHPAWGPIRGGRIRGQIYTPELNGQGFYLFMRGRPERNNNAIPDEEIQLPCVWSGLVVNQAAADIMWTDSAQTTFDGGWEAASRRAKSWGTLLLWCSQCVTLSTAGWMDLDEFVWSSLVLLAGVQQHKKHLWLLW